MCTSKRSASDLANLFRGLTVSSLALDSAAVITASETIAATRLLRINAFIRPPRLSGLSRLCRLRQRKIDPSGVVLRTGSPTAPAQPAAPSPPRSIRHGPGGQRPGEAAH